MKLRAGGLVLTVAAVMPLGAIVQDLAPEVLLLSRIERAVAREFSLLPDYTCVETVQRFRRMPGRAKMEPLGTVYLEVLYSGEKELYSAPGEGRFSEGHPSRVVAQGMMGNGDFALRLKSIFLDRTAQFTYRGREEHAGRAAARYGFWLPRLLSGYTVLVSGGSGIVGLRGSFWADPQTLELLRVETAADEIPPLLPVRAVTTSAECARVRLGTRDVVMVQSAAVRMLENSGKENFNWLEYTHCRLFQAQSAIRFEGSDAERSIPPGTASGGDGEENVPAPFAVTVELTSEIREGDAVGTPIVGRVVGDVKRRGRVLIPDGAVTKGRIRRLEHAKEPGFLLAFEFTEIELKGRPMRFYADILRVESGRKDEISLAKRTDDEAGIRVPEVPGVASLLLRGERLQVPKFLRLVWRTKPFGNEE